MRTIRVKLYKFSELSKEAQETAISEFIDDRLNYSFSDDYENWPNFKKAIDKAEELQTPWFTGPYVYDFCKQEIIDMLTDDSENSIDASKYTIQGKIF